MMARETVPAAMAAAYRAAEGDLAERMLAALLAAEAEGGDVRGRQSAALLVVPATGEPWRARFDVRVEDHGDPLAELQRLVRLARAYEMAGEADELVAEGEPRARDRALRRRGGAGARSRRAHVLGRARRGRAGPRPRRGPRSARPPR